MGKKKIKVKVGTVKFDEKEKMIDIDSGVINIDTKNREIGGDEPIV